MEKPTSGSAQRMAEPSTQSIENTVVVLVEPIGCIRPQFSIHSPSSKRILICIAWPIFFEIDPLRQFQIAHDPGVKSLQARREG